MASKKPNSDRERPTGSTKLRTRSNTSSQSNFRNRFDILDDQENMENSFACDLNLESCSDSDFDRDETSLESESDIPESTGMSGVAKDYEHLKHQKDCSKVNYTKENPRQSYGSLIGNQSHDKPDKPMQNYSYLQRSSADNQMKNRPSQNNGSYKAQRVFYNTRLKEERNRPSTSQAQSYKSETYPGNKVKNVAPVNKNNQYTNQKSNKFKENNTNNGNNKSFQSSNGNFKTTDKFIANSREREKFQNPYRESQALKSNYQPQQKKCQSAKGNFQTSDGGFQKPSRNSQYPQTEFQTSDGNLQSSSGKFGASDGKFQTAYGKFQQPNRKFQSLDGKFQTTDEKSGTTNWTFQAQNGKCQMPHNSFLNSNSNFSSNSETFQSKDGRFQPESNLQDNYVSNGYATFSHNKHRQYSQQSSDLNFSQRYDNQTDKPSHLHYNHHDGFPNSYAWSGDFQQYNQHQKKSFNETRYPGEYPDKLEEHEHAPAGPYNKRAGQFEKQESSYNDGNYFSNTKSNNSGSLSSIESIDDTKFYSARRSSFDSIDDGHCERSAFQTCDRTGVNLARLTNERLEIPRSMFNNDYIRNYYK